MSLNSNHLDQFLIDNGFERNKKDLFHTALSKVEIGELSVHPYGFYIVKPEVGTKYQLRFHVWLENIRKLQKPEWPPHNHNFAINSLIMEGEVEQTIWDISDSLKSINTLYEVKYDGNISQLIKTENEVNCTIHNKTTYKQGKSYYLSSEDYHSIMVQFNKSAVTLCLMTNPKVITSKIVGLTGGDTLYKFQRQNVSTEEQHLVIKQLKKCFSKYT